MVAKKLANDILIEAYGRLGNVWKVADEVGLCGQSVHQRLTKIGAMPPMRVFSDAERDILTAEYEKHADEGRLDELAERMQRTRQFICRQAKAMGLTAPNRKRPYHSGEVGSLRAKAVIAKYGHPRGMLGKTHSDAMKDAMSKRLAERRRNMSDDERAALAEKSDGKKSWKGGWRIVGPQRKYFRSRWEANFARYLQHCIEQKKIQSWEHEPVTFWFDGIKRGVCSYKPDFRVTENDGTIVWYEVKGWMDDRSRVALKRMKKYHPRETVRLIEKPIYKAIECKIGWQLDGWE